MEIIKFYYSNTVLQNSTCFLMENGLIHQEHTFGENLCLPMPTARLLLENQPDPGYRGSGKPISNTTKK